MPSNEPPAIGDVELRHLQLRLAVLEDAIGQILRDLGVPSKLMIAWRRQTARPQHDPIPLRMAMNEILGWLRAADDE